MCGSNPLEELEDAAKDVGKSFEKNVTKPIVGGVKDVGDFIQDEVIDPVKEFGSSLEDAVRDAADDVNKVIENPYVQTVVSIFNPAAGAVLSAYATLNSGDELSAGQIAALATAGYAQGTGVSLSPEIKKAIDAGITIADGGDVKDALINAYGGDFAKELGLDTKVKDSLSGFVGSDFAQRINDNIDFNQAAADYAAGNSTERILANQFGDDVVNYLGAETPTQQAFGYAGIETALQKAEGASDEDALLAGAKTYYDRGGALPDLNTIGSLAGIQDFNLNLNDVVGNLGLDFPDLSLQGYDLPSLANLGIDLNQFSFEAPDILDMNLSLPEIAGLGLDLGNVKFEGYSPQDLGFDVGELADLGINLGDLNLDFETLGLGLALQGQQPREFTPEGDEIALLENEFLVPQIETPFSQQVLGNLKIV